MTLGGHVANLAKIGGTVIVLGAVAYVGEHPGIDGGMLQDVWNALKTASPPVSMVLFLFLLKSEAERRQAQRETSERTIDFIKSTNAAAAALERVLGRRKRATRGRAR